MAWNTRHTTKSLSSDDMSKKVAVGAPIATNPWYTTRGYSDGWDIEKAYQDGMRAITWVFRAIDVIAGNQARLPMVLKKDNSPDGMIVKDKDLLDLLNSRSNVGEDSFVFRYRLSAQLLMSTRGVFIEVIRGRNGKPVSLSLLPPQHTAPIPHPKTFVSGYEVSLPNGQIQRLRPDQVIWIRKPHPLDPYRSMTPMESAGMAMQIENLAKLYNRNFLLNDGRPGGLVVVRGEMEQEDIDELRSRFRGDLSRTGQISVLASEDGADYMDLSSTPRDAAYLEMRNLTKEEILAAFGVPESVIGNAAGRTFSNAAEEGRVFWMETMLPHLEPISRALDALDEDLYTAFDIESVPILILAKQEREKYLLEELRTGAITYNEYREGTGRKKVKAELSDALLANPNLTPIGNTEKEMKLEDPNAQQPVGAAVPPGEIPGTQPTAPGQPPSDPAGGGGVPAATPPQPTAPPGVQQASLSPDVSTKSFVIETADLEDWEKKSAETSDRWTEITARSVERLFERQQRVVMEKANGKKSAAALAAGTLTAAMLFDTPTWDRQMEDDLRPVIVGAVLEGINSIGKSVELDQNDPELKLAIDAQMQRLRKVNQTTFQQLSQAVTSAASLQEDQRQEALQSGISEVFAKMFGTRRRQIAEVESQAALNTGTHYAGEKSGLTEKVWMTRRDGRVRAVHVPLHGEAVKVGDDFLVDGFAVRYPGDPLAPAHVSIGCRCRLRFQ